MICQTVCSIRLQDDTILTASGKSISELQVTINHDLANVKQ